MDQVSLTATAASIIATSSILVPSAADSEGRLALLNQSSLDDLSTSLGITVSSVDASAQALKSSAPPDGFAQHSLCPGEWIDVDSPSSACSTLSHRNGERLELVFSDEVRCGFAHSLACS